MLQPLSHKIAVRRRQHWCYALTKSLVHRAASRVLIRTQQIGTKTWHLPSGQNPLSFLFINIILFSPFLMPCSSTMRRPVRASDGFVYEESSVRIYFAKERRYGRPLRSPMTGVFCTLLFYDFWSQIQLTHSRCNFAKRHSPFRRRSSL